MFVNIFFITCIPVHACMMWHTGIGRNIEIMVLIQCCKLQKKQVRNHPEKNNIIPPNQQWSFVFVVLFIFFSLMEQLVGW